MTWWLGETVQRPTVPQQSALPVNPSPATPPIAGGAAQTPGGGLGPEWNQLDQFRKAMEHMQDPSKRTQLAGVLARQFQPPAANVFQPFLPGQMPQPGAGFPSIGGGTPQFPQGSDIWTGLLQQLRGQGNAG